MNKKPYIICVCELAETENGTSQFEMFCYVEEIFFLGFRHKICLSPLNFILRRKLYMLSVFNDTITTVIVLFSVVTLFKLNMQSYFLRVLIILF